MYSSKFHHRSTYLTEEIIFSVAAPVAMATSMAVELSRLAQTPETPQHPISSQDNFSFGDWIRTPQSPKLGACIRLLIFEEEDNISGSVLEWQTRAQNGNFLIYSLPSIPSVSIVVAV